MTNIDNTHTLVKANLLYVRTMLNDNLRSLKRSLTTVDRKYGPHHAITRGWQEEVKTLETVINTLEQAK